MSRRRLGWGRASPYVLPNPPSFHLALPSCSLRPSAFLLQRADGMLPCRLLFLLMLPYCRRSACDSLGYSKPSSYIGPLYSGLLTPLALFIKITNPWTLAMPSPVCLFLKSVPCVLFLLELVLAAPHQKPPHQKCLLNRLCNLYFRCMTFHSSVAEMWLRGGRSKLR